MLDLNVLARLAKIIALGGFFLPWAAISCSHVEVATATGLQLIVGELQPSPELLQLNGGRVPTGYDQEKRYPNYHTLAALLAIVLGLVVSLFVSRRVAAGALLVTSLLSAGLCYHSLEVMRDMSLPAMTERQSRERAAADLNTSFEALGDSMAAAMAAAIDVEERVGFFVTLGGLAAAFMFGAVGVALREQTNVPQSDNAER